MVKRKSVQRSERVRYMLSSEHRVLQPTKSPMLNMRTRKVIAMNISGRTDGFVVNCNLLGTPSIDNTSK